MDQSIYSVDGSLKVVEETEEDGEVVKEALDGNMGISIGGEPYSREYQVNGTLTWKNNNKNADLAIHGRF
jgi:hypothetical protein